MKTAFFRKVNWFLVYCFVIAALFLGICSKSSPLYPMNDWVDVHCFFTMGRSILEGIVPYRDLYEQKGPVLYFIYAIIALFSSKTFLGVFLMEVIVFGAFLYFSGKIAEIYLGKCPILYLIVAILAAIIPVSPAFAHGAGAEETCLFMLTYGLYTVLKALHNQRPLSFREAFFNGLCAAAVLYIKFTMLGFYMGLALFVIVWYISRKYSIPTLLTTIGQFLLGLGALSLLVFGYFLIHGAVNDFIQVYFYNNLFLYPTEIEGSRWEMIWKCLDTTLTRNESYAWLMYCSLIFLCVIIKNHWRDLIMGLLSFSGLVIGTYWGGRGYTYYGLILCIYAVFGLIGLVSLLRLVPLRKWLNQLTGEIPLISWLALTLSVSLLLAYSFENSNNTYLMTYEKEDMPAYRFAQTIKTVENPTLLNYGFLDAGFYFAADVTPNCEFFCTLNINAPDMWAIQRECIENGDVDFVITRRYPLNRYSANSSNYTLVDEATMWFEGVDFTYYLYQKLPVS